MIALYSASYTVALNINDLVCKEQEDRCDGKNSRKAYRNDT